MTTTTTRRRRVLTGKTMKMMRMRMRASESNARAWGHSARASVGLIPALCVTVASGGETSMTIVFVGLMVAYVLDLMRAAEGALGTTWCALAGAFAAHAFGATWITPGMPVLVNFVVLMLNGANLMLGGLWVTLQFRWVHHAYPGAAATCERAIFAYAPLVCGTVIAWAFATSMNAQIASLYISMTYIIMHRLFMFPIIAECAYVEENASERSASGTATKTTHKRRVVTTPSDAKSGTIATVSLPLMFYVGLNFWEIFADFEHLFTCLMLVSSPVLYFISAGTERSLWWIAENKSGSETLESLILVAAFALFAAGFEGGIIFAGFAEYIQVPAPLSYVMVTISVYSASAAFLAHCMNAVGSILPVGVMQGALVLATSNAMIVIGAPMMMVPVPVIGSIAFARYYQSQQLHDYIVFACSAATCFGWFMLNHFWSLDINVGGVSLSYLCLGIFILSVSAVVLPSVLNVARHIRRSFVGVFILAYVALLAAIEQVLSHAIHDDGSTIYPPYLVLVTSVLGVLASRSLILDGRLTQTFGWLAQSACLAKLSMLLIPRLSEMFSVFIVLLTVSAPYVKFQGSRRVMHRMTGGHCAMYAASLVVSLLFARFAMFDIIFEMTGHRPTDAVMLGGVLVMTGASLVPVTANVMGDEPVSKRLVMLLLASGVFFVTFRPPLPWKGEVGMWYDAEHVPDTEDDDARMYGARETVHHGWPSWLLMLSFLTALVAVSSPREQGEWTSTVRAIFSVMCGGCVGLYMALEYFSEQAGLSVMLFVACALVGVFLSFTYVPSKSSFDYLPYVYFAYVAILLLAYYSQTEGSTEMMDDADIEDAMENKLGVISVFAGTSLQIAFALKFRIRSTLERHVRRKRVASDSPFLPAAARNRPEHFRNVSSRSAHREMRAQAVSWMPIVGNIATLTSFAACLMLSEEFANGSALSVFALAPILLLLHQDTMMFPILEDSQRYAPPLAMVIGKLCYDTVLAIAAGPNKVHVLTLSASKVPWMISNIFALACASVNSINLVHFLATNVRTSTETLLITAPLGILAPLFSKITAVRVLALTSACAAAIQHAMQRRRAVAGLKYL